jgi:DNA end-binding protein Ku
MPRPLWNGVLTFGLVNIPVELFPAEEHREFKLSMLDKRDFSPVGYKRYSKNTGREVDWNDVVKGYEYEKDQYVVLSDEDFRRANTKASRTIEISMFVAQSDIPPQYYETPYYLVPGQNGEKVYALFREALRATGRMAVAQFVMRSAQHLAAVGPVGRALMLVTLRYEDELRDSKGLELPAASLKGAQVSGKEIDLAKRLIDDMTGIWDPKRFRDTYHEVLMARIRQKVRKRETHEITGPEEPAAEPRSAQVIDLAALLKKSLGGTSRRKTTAPRRSKHGSGTRLHVVGSPPAKTRPRRKNG